MKKIFLLLFMYLLAYRVYAQQIIKFNSPISPSPTAASLGKYGDIPVSTYTGIPEIEIPLYEIKIGINTLPIKISYYAGGIKVSDESSPVGLGWSLNAGGVITRVKKMIDDLSPKGYYKNSNHSSPPDGTDREPDIFYFNFANYSGKFVIDYSSNTSRPYNIRFVSNYNDDNLKVDLVNEDYWLITDKYGVIYEFRTKEIQFDNTLTEGNYSGTVDNAAYTSSWYLNKITYTDGNEIGFGYDIGAQIEKLPMVNLSISRVNGFATSIPSSCFQPSYSGHFSKTTYNVKVNAAKLNSILFRGGKIDFSYSADRIDLKTAGTPSERLTKITIFNKTQAGFNLIKTFNLNQSYFSSSSRANYLSKRLRLDKISEQGTDNSLKEYIFSYNAISLPDKDSKDIDHWGYYNGPNNNQDLFPDPNIAARNPNPTYVKACLLQNIVYPTKLKTNFEFEINDFSNLGSSLSWSSNNSDNTGMIGAGVRIREITNIDNTSAVLYTKKQFEYKLTSGTNSTSSGKIMSKINYNTPYEYIFFGSFGWGNSCSQYNGVNIKEIGIASYTDSSIPISGDAQGNVIGYDVVTTKNISGSDFIKSVEEYNNFSTASLNSSPRVPNVNNNMNGLLKSKTDYLTPNGLESIVKKTEFEYETKESTIIKGYMIQGGLYQNTLDLLPYDILSSWIVNKKIIEKDFDINNLFAEKSTNFSFDANNKQKIAEDYLDSKGDTYSTKYLYPKDLVTQGNTNPYQDMELRNMSGIVIQIEKYKNSTLLNKTYNDYAKSWISNPDLILPKAVRTQYKSNNPENRIIYNSYDPRGNVTNVSYEKGPPTSYKWGYIEQYPIAEIKNSAVNEFYSQNFEEPELGLDFEANVVTDDAQVHTGKYSGRIINPNSTEFVSHSSKRLNISLTAPKKFTFSGWVFSNGPSVQLFLFMMKAGETGYNSYYDHMQTTTTNKWVYMKKEFLVPADVVQMFLRLDNNAAGTVWFDDLRIQPSDASMSTYTYEPLVGMTSAIDDSGKTVYYEYDDFKRLMNIKDQNGFIIKNYDYHYKP